MAKRIITFQIDEELNKKLEKIAKGTELSKSWIIKQAIKQYIDRFDELFSDIRIATLKEGKNHQEILKEYGISDKMGQESV